eukprot:362478-Chlamydomonas_euryale.AAC.5
MEVVLHGLRARQVPPACCARGGHPMHALHASPSLFLTLRCRGCIPHGRLAARWGPILRGAPLPGAATGGWR